MKFGNILFLFVPDDENFFHITYNSLFRHDNKGKLQPYGVYVFSEKNKKEWKRTSNIYANIIYFVNEVKYDYDLCILIKGNTFFNLKDIYPLTSIIGSIDSASIASDSLVFGTSFFLESELKMSNCDTSSQSRYHLNYIRSIYPKLEYFLDYDFCFINLKDMRDSYDATEILDNLQFEPRFDLVLPNSIYYNYSSALEDNIYWKPKYDAKISNVKVLFEKYQNNIVYSFNSQEFMKESHTKYNTLYYQNLFLFTKLKEEYLLVKDELQYDYTKKIDYLINKSLFVENVNSLSDLSNEFRK